MALRDKLRSNAQAHLDQGETIQAAFPAQTGPSPYFLLLSYIFFFWLRSFVVAATDRRIVVFKSSVWRPSLTREIVDTHPRETRLGPPGKGLYHAVHLGDERYWVHRRFFKDVRAADEALPSPAPAA
jgi:hypothetical protein